MRVDYSLGGPCSRQFSDGPSYITVLSQLTEQYFLLRLAYRNVRISCNELKVLEKDLHMHDKCHIILWLAPSFFVHYGKQIILTPANT